MAEEDKINTGEFLKNYFINALRISETLLDELKKIIPKIEKVETTTNNFLELFHKIENMFFQVRQDKEYILTQISQNKEKILETENIIDEIDKRLMLNPCLFKEKEGFLRDILSERIDKCKNCSIEKLEKNFKEALVKLQDNHNNAIEKVQEIHKSSMTICKWIIGTLLVFITGILTSIGFYGIPAIVNKIIK